VRKGQGKINLMPIDLAHKKDFWDKMSILDGGGFWVF
jgi:hypothetical protein